MTTTPNTRICRLRLRRRYRHLFGSTRCRSTRRHGHAPSRPRFRCSDVRRSQGSCRQMTTTPTIPNSRLRLRRRYRHLFGSTRCRSTRRHGHAPSRPRSRRFWWRRSQGSCRQMTMTPSVRTGRLRLRHRYRDPSGSTRCRSTRRHGHAPSQSHSRRCIGHRLQGSCRQMTTTPKILRRRLRLRHQCRIPIDR